MVPSKLPGGRRCMASRLLDQVNVQVVMSNDHAPIRAPSSAARSVAKSGKNCLAVSSAERAFGRRGAEFSKWGRLMQYTFLESAGGRRDPLEIKRPSAQGVARGSANKSLIADSAQFREADGAAAAFADLINARQCAAIAQGSARLGGVLRRHIPRRRIADLPVASIGQHDHLGADLDAAEEIDHVLIEH